MSRVSCAASIFALASFAIGCDVEQPLRLDQQIYELRLTAPGATVPIYIAYEMFEGIDADGDGAPDDTDMDGFPDTVDNDGDGEPDKWRFCRTATNANDDTRFQNALSVPVGAAVEIAVTRAATGQREVLTSREAFSDTTRSIAQYDTSPPLVGAVPPEPAIVRTIGGVERIFFFANGELLTSARPEVLRADFNPLSEAFPGDFPLGDGLCSAADPGPVGIDRPSGFAYPFPIDLASGDVVTITVRRAIDGPLGLNIVNAPGAPQIAGFFSLDGQRLPVNGSTTAGGPNGAFSFNFITR